MSGYANTDVLVTTDWVKENLGKPKIKLVEVDVDTKAYEAGHIPGAVGFNWQTQLQDSVRRDIVGKEAFESLMSAAGIANDDTIVLYGDNNNWFAAYAFWLFKMYGHRDVRLMDGGRVKWLNESDKSLTTDPPKVTPSRYSASSPELSLRARVQNVLAAVDGRTHNLIDVRSPDEFTGKVIAPPGMTETAQRAGHIPGAASVPWAQTVREDGTFKSPEDLRALYEAKGVTPDKDVIAYCRIGERSSHTWFVLHELLGYDRVRNYDGSWTEWGSMVNVPIEKAAPASAG